MSHRHIAVCKHACLLVTVAMLVCQLLLYRSSVLHCHTDMALRLSLPPLPPVERRISDQNKTKRPVFSLFFIPFSLFSILRPLTGAIYISGGPLFWQGNGAGMAVCRHDKVRILSLTWRPKWQGFWQGFWQDYSSAMAAILSERMAVMVQAAKITRRKIALSSLIRHNARPYCSQRVQICTG